MTVPPPDRTDGLRVELFGPLVLRAADGADLLPRSAKTRGLVALLVTGVRMTRSRVWLQERLWSDRNREQRSASLRQALTELRRALGDRADCLITDRKSVAFDADRVELVQDRRASTEFLEGLDIRDRGFQDWLRAQRSRYFAATLPARESGPETGTPPVSGTSGAASTQPFRSAPVSGQVQPAAQRRLLILSDPVRSSGMEGFFAGHFADSVARSLAEQIGLQVITADDARASGVPDDCDLILRTRASLSPGLAGMNVSMERGPDRINLWSGSELVQTAGAPPLDHENLLRLIHEVTEGVTEAMYDASRTGAASLDAGVLARIAIRKLFSMEKSEQLTADGMLATAYELQPKGVYLAWRVFLRIVMLIERHAGLPDDYAEQAQELSARSMELEPLNSMVLAAASNAAMILRADDVAGLEYAERSLKANPANPFAWDCLSVAALYHGKSDRAHALQLKARRIASHTPFGHWFDMGCSMTATSAGQLDDAITWARKSAAMSPSFHPPLRYLIALLAHSGRLREAIDIVRRLKALEPDFTVHKLVEDDEYPVADLRRSRLLTAKTINSLR